MSNELDQPLTSVETFRDERRSVERFTPPVDPTYLWISVDKRIRAKLVDESESGIGLIVPVAFEIGFRVRVDHRLGRRMAKVVHLIETENGCYRLGLSWID